MALADDGAPESLTLKMLPRASYRVSKIVAKCSSALDQIKFVYDDDSVWSVGHDSGRSAPAAVLVEGEHIHKVRHEQFLNNRCAGASLEVTTNMGRRFAFAGRSLATGWSSEATSVTAEPGCEIVSLVVRRGVLRGTVQQPAAPALHEGPAAEWYTIVSMAEDGGVETQHHFTWRSARSAWAATQQDVTTAEAGAALLTDTLARRVIRNVGSAAAVKLAHTAAVKAGLAATAGDPDVDFKQVAVVLWSLLSQDWGDTAIFLLVACLVMASSWFTVRSRVLSGKVAMAVTLPNITRSALQDNWVADGFCNHLFGNCDDDSVSVRYAFILTFVTLKSLAAVIKALEIFLQAYVGRLRQNRLVLTVFSKIMRLDMSFYDTHSIQDVTAAMGVSSVHDTLLNSVPSVLHGASTVLSTAYMMAQISLPISIVFVCGTVAMKYGLHLASQANRAVQLVQSKLSMLSNQVKMEPLEHALTVKTMGKEEYHVEQYAAIKARQAAHDMQSAVVKSLVQGVVFGVADVAIMGVIYAMVIHTFNSGDSSASDVVSFLSLADTGRAGISKLRGAVRSLTQNLPKLERFWALMEKQPAITSGSRRPKSVAGDYVFDNVHFAYPARPGQEALRGVSFSIRSGAMTAIVGDSGAGKSTITKLLLRLYDPSSGTVSLDGVDLREWDTTYLRQHIAVVNQDPALFNASLAENIAYGSVDGVYDLEAVEGAARQARCHEFIEGFRGGYDTFAGAGGGHISGGQKQRVSIARAIMRDPAILVLDEATSALDAENERLVQGALEAAMAGRTIVVVAHRLSTVVNADHIICMKAGRVVEEGSHASLMALKGHYAQLVSTQLVQR